MDKYLELYHNQDEVMENIMLFSPMPVLQAIQDSYLESILADMHAEDAELFSESVPVRPVRKLSKKQRRAARRVQNHRHALRDRYHGKRGKEWKYAGEYASHDFRMYSAGMNFNRNLRRESMDAATMRDALDITRVERLTASILAEVNQYHGYMGYTWAVMALVDELHKVYQYDLPDYAHVCRTHKGNISLVLEYEEYDKNWEEPYTRNVYVDLLHLA